MSLNFENPAGLLLNRVRDGVLLLDHNLSCVYANQTALDLLPRLADAPGDASIWDIFSDEAQSPLARSVERVRAEGLPMGDAILYSLAGSSYHIRIFPEAEGCISLYLLPSNPLSRISDYTPNDGYSLDDNFPIFSGHLQGRNPPRLPSREMPLLDREDEVTGLFGALLNMAERTEQQDALNTSEARYRTIFEQTPISLWEEDYSAARRRLLKILDSGVTDLRAYLTDHPEVVQECLETVTVLAVNETSVALYGAADKDDLIRSLSKLIPPETRQDLKEFLVHLVQGDGFADQEVVDLTLSGEKLYLLRRAVPLPSADPDEARYLIALIDMTARRRIEEDLRRQAVLLDEISDAVILTDMQTVIRSWNRAAEEIYGWRAEEVIGKSVGQVLHTRFSSGGAEEAAASLIANGRWDAEVEQQRKDGIRISVSVSVSLLTDGEGNPSGMVAVNRDITELVRSRNAMRDAEQRYRQLFEEAPLMYLTFDVADGQPLLQDVNQAYLRATGFERHEVIGRNFVELMGEKSREIGMKGFQAVLQGDSVEGERVLLRRDGGRVDALLRAVPRFDQNGQVAATLVMYVDISRRKRAEQQQRKEAERTRTLLHIAARLNRRLGLQELARTICEEISVALHVPAVTLSLLESGGTHFIHRADVGLSPGLVDRMKPFPVPQWLKGDLPIDQLVRFNPIESLVASPNYLLYRDIGLETGVNLFLVRDKMLIGSVNLIITDPNRRFDDEDASLLRGVADMVTQAILNAQLWEETLHHSHRLEDQVRQRTADLETALFHAQEADRIKSHFVSEMNHELRTPLMNITLYLDILASGRPDKRDHALEIMRRETARLHQLIEDVLDISRLDLHRLQVEPESVYLDRLVEDLLADRAALLERSPVKVHFAANDSLPPVQADPNLMGRVLTNLLDNALNYSRQGVVRIRSRREERENRHWQVLSIADNGPGIAPEDLPQIFERFYRGQAARESGAPGTGLGLAICQEIVDRHGGYITVDSKPGAGSTFSIWLPVDGLAAG